MPLQLHVAYASPHPIKLALEKHDAEVFESLFPVIAAGCQTFPKQNQNICIA